MKIILNYIIPSWNYQMLQNTILYAGKNQVPISKTVWPQSTSLLFPFIYKEKGKSPRWKGGNEFWVKNFKIWPKTRFHAKSEVNISKGVVLPPSPYSQSRFLVAPFTLISFSVITKGCPLFRRRSSERLKAEEARSFIDIIEDKYTHTKYKYLADREDKQSSME